MTDGPKFAASSCSAAQIAKHLVRCDNAFVPPLSSRTDIAEYAAKLRDRAFTFEAWQADVLVGLVGMYMDVAAGTAFISNVSVDPLHVGEGTGSRLLAEALAFARRSGVVRVSLEVSRGAAGAIRLYARHGFVVARADAQALGMQLDIQRNR